LLALVSGCKAYKLMLVGFLACSKEIDL
jgi:hypothetical protein